MKSKKYLYYSALFGNLSIFLVLGYFWGLEAFIKVKQIFNPNYIIIYTEPTQIFKDKIPLLISLAASIPCILLTIHFLIKWKQEQTKEKTELENETISN